MFGNREKEHSIMRYPAFFLVGGVSSLFIGFMCGIVRACEAGRGTRLKPLCGCKLLGALLLPARLLSHPL